jgi:hypothetical protein
MAFIIFLTCLPLIVYSEIYAWLKRRLLIFLEKAPRWGAPIWGACRISCRGAGLLSTPPNVGRKEDDCLAYQAHKAFYQLKG